MAKEFTKEDDDLLVELGVEVELKKPQKYTPKQERIIAGFEEIQNYVEENGRIPTHNENGDIFERIYAVRLDRIRSLKECYDLVQPLDHQGLLDKTFKETVQDDVELDDDALLEELGVETSNLQQLKHVRSSAEKQAAEEIANRETCKDFDKFKPLFESVQKDLELKRRITRKIRKDAGFLKTDIRKGEFFILSGQIVYIADVGDPIKAPNGQTDARLRAIYSNGTESNILLRSLQRALYKDETSRRITSPDYGPLFDGEPDQEDLESGTIYVLRSKSEHPQVAEHREILHKIGVTGGKIEKRIANAKKEATYLLADVEVVASYQLYNINRTKLENLIHKFFAEAQLDIEIKDRFGNPVKPKEWFCVPLAVIDELVKRLREGRLTNCMYSTETCSIETSPPS